MHSERQSFDVTSNSHWVKGHCTPVLNIMHTLRNVKAVKYSGWLPIEAAADEKQGSAGTERQAEYKGVK